MNFITKLFNITDQEQPKQIKYFHELRAELAALRKAYPLEHEYLAKKYHPLICLEFDFTRDHAQAQIYDFELNMFNSFSNKILQIANKDFQDPEEIYCFRAFIKDKIKAEQRGINVAQDKINEHQTKIDELKNVLNEYSIEKQQ